MDAELVRPDPTQNILKLYKPLVVHFPTLAGPNLFTAEFNTFRGKIVVESVLHTSDARCKRDIEELRPMEGLRVVRSTDVYTYRFHNEEQPSGRRRAAGFLADTVPPEYTDRDPVSGTLVLDYNAMLANLWAAVKQLTSEVDALREAQRRSDAVSGL